MASFVEIERAFEVPAEAVMPTWPGATGPSVVELDATYWDTPRFDLLRAGATLRRRTGGGDEGWHLKLPDGRQDGERRRIEHHAPVGDPDEPPRELLDLVRARVRDRPLAPVARVRTRRSTLHVPVPPAAVVEVSDDHVSAGPPDGVATTWREWEVEVTGGDAAALGPVVDALSRVDGVRARGEAKLARVLGERAPAAVQLAPADGSAGELVRSYLATHLERLVAADAGVRAGDDDAVHDARVATRRLRTALAVFRTVNDPPDGDPGATTRALREQLRALGHLLGAARDPVVESAALGRTLAQEPVELVLGDVARRIADDRSSARSAALGVLRDHLDDPATPRMLDALDDLAGARLRGPDADADGLRLVRRVRKTWRRMDAALDAAADLPDGPERDAALHAARKAARRARYAAEVVVPVVGRPARRSARRARDVQDALGRQHDTVVRRATLRRLGVEAYLGGGNAFTLGRLHALEQVAGEELVRRAAEPIRRARARKARAWLG
ncbi:CYTH and CHAD domain-containing protein [Cellulomonas edaphi]|uniref:CYTH and CHAD domain-containing protein n=1 Tax=Cellulomonas edaphi TaxID=3053468 RepID=A0ABT7S7B4_9CELL|nr:CYTH and CHAD domain-containing protein [Cellulomons edaphi]MDM7831509.1 CYTH and CHAD domain-containing protein [Cellulomons edaphi]